MTDIVERLRDGKTVPLMEERNAAADEIERLRLDAARYRWLRNRIPGSAYRIAGIIYSEGGDGVDRGIDAAMKG